MTSEVHQEMTYAILEFSRRQYIGWDNSEWLITMDHCSDWHGPPAIKGYRPDLHIWNKCSRITIIGEAKTEGDLMTDRSQKQINGFIDYLAERKQDAILILCVALNQVSDARYIITSNQMTKKITTHVIDRSKYEHHHAERL